MYITETGIADMKDDRRAIMIDSYFKAVSPTVHWPLRDRRHLIHSSGGVLLEIL